MEPQYKAFSCLPGKRKKGRPRSSESRTMNEIVRIAFVGSRGIPAKYGGPETFMEEISQRLEQRRFEVYVTCHSHRFGKDEYNGVIRLHTPSIEGKTLTVPAVNEFLATIHLLIRCPKVKLVYYLLSYSALAALIPKLLGKKVVMITDGIEWKRPLERLPYFSLSWKLLAVATSWFMRLTERLAVKLSHVVIADSRVIEAYLEERYKAKNVAYISYGARELLNSDIAPREEHEILHGFGLSTGGYYLTVGRIVAENNIHMEIEGFKRSSSNRKLVIVGNFNDKDGYNKYLLKLRDGDPKIAFLDAIYDKEVLGVLRKNCFGYIHAYQVGGTNPSLLEQMLFKKPIIAYDNSFHREVLLDGGVYFWDDEGLASAIVMLEKGKADLKKIAECQTKRIEKEYNWDNIADKYASLFRKLLLAAPD